MKRLVCKDCVKRKIVVLSLLVISAMQLSADEVKRAEIDQNYKNTVELYAPKSPQVAMMERFGNYPVDYSTGVPNISIPLYTIKVGDFELPISIDYHNSGIRVQDISTPVGLGWALNAGGCISHAVMGMDDSDPGETITGIDDIWDRIEKHDSYRESHVWDAIAANKYYDTQSDRYCYNFAGHHGIFRHDMTEFNYQTLPHSDMKIEAKERKRYSSVNHYCYFTIFEITDDKGIKYTFEYPEVTKGDYTHGNSYASAYYLTKILLPNGKDSIRFFYSQASDYCTQYYAEHKEYGANWVVSSYAEYNQLMPALSLQYNQKDNFSETHTCEVVETKLDSIVWNGCCMKFDYAADRKEVKLGTQDAQKRLVSAYVKNSEGNIVRHISFDNDHYMGGHAFNYRMLLNSVTIDNDTNTDTYTFDYNQSSLPKYCYVYTINPYHETESDWKCHEDYWGFYNGRSEDSWIPQKYSYSGKGGNREPSAKEMLAGSLKSITYPTGGRTEYEMEANRLDDGTIWGGLRVRMINNYTANGKLSDWKYYTYENPCPAMDTVWLNKIYKYETNCCYHYNPDWSPAWDFRGGVSHNAEVSTPIINVMGDYCSPIFYHKVTEHHGSSKDSLGYTVYEYYEARTDDMGSWKVYMDTVDEFAYEPYWRFSQWNNFDYGNISAELSSVTEYKQDGTLMKSVQNYYEDQYLDTIRVGVRVSPTTNWYNYSGTGSFFTYIAREGYEMQDKLNAFKKWIKDNFAIHHVWGVPSYRRLVFQTVTQDGITKRIDYTYDTERNSLKPLSIKTRQGISNGWIMSTSSTPLTTTYTYPFESKDDVAMDMTRKNMLVPLKTTTTRNGTVMRTDSVAYGFVADGIQQKEYYTSLGTDTLEKRLTYSYDSKGRVQSLTTDAGDCTVFVWGNRNDWPIAKIEGKTLQEIKNIIGAGMYQNIFYDNPNETMLFAAKDLLQKKNCSVIVYDHETLVGVKSVIHPNNNAEYFDYDSMGRLIRRKENKAIREEYQYNYRK